MFQHVPFFSGSGSSSVLNFTEEGASMPSERADHSIVNYHDETPGAVDDVLTVRALVSNNFDAFVGGKNQQYRSDLVIWWFDDLMIICLFVFGECIVYRSNLLGDIGRWFFIQWFCQVRFCCFWWVQLKTQVFGGFRTTWGYYAKTPTECLERAVEKTRVQHGTKIPFSKRESC